MYKTENNNHIGTTLSIPPVALGTWSWGTGLVGGNEIFGNHLQESDLAPVFQTAMKAGLTLWDTAPVYGMGAAETILGKFMSQSDPCILSTKFMPLGIQPKSAMATSLAQSLQRLGKESADIFWLHTPNNIKKWIPELIPLYQSGKIRHIGISNHNKKEMILAASILKQAGIALSAVQNHFSLLYHPCLENGILDWCLERNITFFSYMVLEQGALSGVYTADNPLPKGSRRCLAFSPRTLKKLEPLLLLMSEIASQHGVTTADIATAWAITKGTVPIIGVTKPSHVTSAVRASACRLDAAEVKALERCAAKTGVHKKGFWEKQMA